MLTHLGFGGTSDLFAIDLDTRMWIMESDHYPHMEYMIDVPKDFGAFTPPVDQLGLPRLVTPTSKGISLTLQDLGQGGGRAVLLLQSHPYQGAA